MPWDKNKYPEGLVLSGVFSQAAMSDLNTAWEQAQEELK